MRSWQTQPRSDSGDSSRSGNPCGRAPLKGSHKNSLLSLPSDVVVVSSNGALSEAASCEIDLELKHPPSQSVLESAAMVRKDVL